MSGHSKWSTIKRKKGAADAKRGAIFTKMAKIIEVAARSGADPSMNFKLKLAIQRAKAANMPSINIDKAIRKGSGQDKEASQLEEISYEGMGPGNVAVIVNALTDNKNRAVSDIRNIFNKVGGSFGTQVNWQFEAKGIIQVVPNESQKEELEMAALEAGASDWMLEDDSWEVHTPPKELDSVKTKLEAAGFKVEESNLGLVPKNKTTIDDAKLAEKILNFLDSLEDHDDVSEVFSNLDVPDEIMNKLSK
ncbi:MAG: YebC/PmpR family DNA-binding transcriptional regulator [Patescibacteria group bacterium]|nr:YebC/PmpR family DNA-binding transcriptional regulator [Patescibacteria group bacterium]